MIDFREILRLESLDYNYTLMQEENFINRHCHIHIYAYFGSVTRLLIPNNLKAGITGKTRYGRTYAKTCGNAGCYHNSSTETGFKQNSFAQVERLGGFWLILLF